MKNTCKLTIATLALGVVVSVPIILVANEAAAADGWCSCDQQTGGNPPVINNITVRANNKASCSNYSNNHPSYFNCQWHTYWSAGSEGETADNLLDAFDL